MTRPKITLSINPTYFCNFDCSFCYLTPNQLNDKKKLSLERIRKRVSEVEIIYKIICVDVYGGEIGLLGNEYLTDLLKIIPKTAEINFITNFSIVLPVFSDPRVNLSVSWEGDVRRKSQVVLENMRNFNKSINLLILVGPQLLKWSLEKHHEIIDIIGEVNSIKTVELKPYSSNQSNDFEITEEDFERTVIDWLKIDKSFLFVNEENLKQVFNGTKNSFSDDHLYINPDGDFCVLDFHENDNEYFRTVNSIEGYIEWTASEKERVAANVFCAKCDYYGNCLSEHLREVKSVENSCNGYFKLIEWYRHYELS